MDKRTATVSSRIPAELELQVQAIALARDVTVSDLICSALAEVVDRERRTYHRLRTAFEVGQDLPGIPQKNAAAGEPTPAAADTNA